MVAIESRLVFVIIVLRKVKNLACLRPLMPGEVMAFIAGNVKNEDSPVPTHLVLRIMTKIRDPLLAQFSFQLAR